MPIISLEYEWPGLIPRFFDWVEPGHKGGSVVDGCLHLYRTGGTHHYMWHRRQARRCRWNF